jgi:hypothetical protein
MKPAFLCRDIPDRPPKMVPVPRWSPPPTARAVATAAEALPRLAASIGAAASGVEVLPGTPTTVVFTAKQRAVALLVLDVSGDEARRILGIDALPASDPGADRLWEETRQYDYESAS